MSRAGIGKLVVRLYPQDTREQAGNELIGTLLDAGEASRLAFVLQALSVVKSGVWARARVELSRSLWQIAASTLCWVAVMSAMSLLVQTVGIRLRWGDTPGSDPWTVIYNYILPPLILVMFTLRRHRTTGIIGLVWVTIYLYQHPMLPTAFFLGSVPLPAAGFALLVARPRAPLFAGRFLWPAIAGVWLLYQVTLLGQLSGVGKITPVLAALMLLPWAPSLALGTAIAWASTAVYYLSTYQQLNYPHFLVESIELSIGVPIALLILSIARRTAARA
jgi:hypothetical protein